MNKLTIMIKKLNLVFLLSFIGTVLFILTVQVFNNTVSAAPLWIDEDAMCTYKNEIYYDGEEYIEDGSTCVCQSGAFDCQLIDSNDVGPFVEARVQTSLYFILGLSILIGIILLPIIIVWIVYRYVYKKQKIKPLKVILLILGSITLVFIGLIGIVIVYKS